jgi:hypothetical protein
MTRQAGFFFREGEKLYPDHITVFKQRFMDHAYLLVAKRKVDRVHIYLLSDFHYTKKTVIKSVNQIPRLTNYQYIFSASNHHTY